MLRSTVTFIHLIYLCFLVNYCLSSPLSLVIFALNLNFMTRSYFIIDFHRQELICSDWLLCILLPKQIIDFFLITTGISAMRII